MKPRIFINMHYMEIGGAERNLSGLIQYLAFIYGDIFIYN